MRVHVIFAHPVENSFGAAMHTAALEGLREAGHEVDDLDLYADHFDPVLSRQGRLDYHDVTINRSGLERHVDRLMLAEALVFVHPVWNYGWPAIMKGYFDRVWLPDVSFQLVDGALKPNLTHIKSITTVTSYGGGRIRSWLMGDPPKRIGKRVFRALISPTGKTYYLALYAMDKSTPEQRGAFLNKVRAHMNNL